MVKFLKDYFTIKSLRFLLEINWFLRTSQISTRWFFYKSTFSYYSRDLQSFDAYPDVRAVLLDIPEVPDKILHHTLFYK